MHRIIFGPPTLFAVLLLILVVVALWAGSVGAALALVVVDALGYAPAAVNYATSEFAVTDRRLIIKVGWVRRHTLEMLRGKVENISVSQTTLGRILGFGSVQVTRTGGTHEPFANLSQPPEFRRQARAQISEAQHPHAVSRGPEPAAAPVSQPGARAERECPCCAERILAKARVCKHCGKDVDPVVG